MKKLIVLTLLVYSSNLLRAQDYRDDLADCFKERDVVFIDWEDDINRHYAEKERVEQFSKKRIRAFYCQNLVASERLESDGIISSEGSFRFAEDDTKYLVFSIKMGDLIYEDKLYKNIGPSQKLVSVEN